MHMPMRGAAAALVAAIGLFLGGCGVFGPKVDTDAIAGAVVGARPGFSATVDVSTAGGGLAKQMYVLVITGGAIPSEDEFRAVCAAVTSNLGADWVGEIIISFKTSSGRGADGRPAWADIGHITSQVDLPASSKSDHSVQGSRLELEEACALL